MLFLCLSEKNTVIISRCQDLLTLRELVKRSTVVNSYQSFRQELASAKCAGDRRHFAVRHGGLYFCRLMGTIENIIAVIQDFIKGAANLSQNRVWRIGLLTHPHG